VGDVTEEQRKAIVEMAAIVEFGRGFVPPLSYERACEEWKEVASLAKRDLRWDAIAVLESVGYFKLVEAAEGIAQEVREYCKTCALAHSEECDLEEEPCNIKHIRDLVRPVLPVSPSKELI
jgi:hypothetical protein